MSTDTQDGMGVVEIVARALCRHGELLCWETHTSDATRAIAAIESSGKWKLVPVEPTEAMEDAGRKARDAWHDDGEDGIHQTEVGYIYTSMLAAAPKEGQGA